MIGGVGTVGTSRSCVQLRAHRPMMLGQTTPERCIPETGSTIWSRRQTQSRSPLAAAASRRNPAIRTPWAPPPSPTQHVNRLSERAGPPRAGRRR